MSVALRYKRLLSSDVTTTLPTSFPANPAHHKPEARESAELPREAPESRVYRCAEAPDAGEGGTDFLEQDFTHGRSQS
jgi:hypothetical protein